ncbi:MAG: preprotein translocase subunit SecY, partial [Povalibacter sp.]
MTRFAELRQRLFFLLGALIVYRIGTFIPVPGIDPVALSRFFQSQQGTILSMVNMFSGGAISRLSIFALGVMPYISASIIIQMMAVVVPSLTSIKKEGESGRRKLTQYTRYGTVLLAAVQGSSAAIALQNQNVVIAPGPQFVFVATVTLIAGTMFLMWLGEQITERGLGNGISMIILAGIVAGLPAAVAGTLELVRTGELNPAFALILFGMVIAVTAFVVFVERGQRRIQVNYAKRQQ